MASNSSSWLKVASGARLVASAVLKQSAEETGVAAQRILHHGADLSSKAQKTVGTALPSQEVVWSTLRNVIPDPNAAYDAPIMTVKSGTTPYESQLRKKRQRQEMMQASTSEASASTSIDSDMSNPYLFHQQAAVAQTTTINDSETEKVDSMSTTPSDPVAPATNPVPDSSIPNDQFASEALATPTTRLREGQAVPSSRVGRAVGFAGLGAGLAWGAVA